MALHPSRPTTGRHLRIPVGDIKLSGNLVLPEAASSLVIFSHGSGSSRFSVRNNFVAQQLQKRNIGTCLVDLLTAGEDAVYANRFNIDLLTERLIKITQWICGLDEINRLPTGYFGASTGAASALKAAARLKQRIAAVVSRGGRPDLAHAKLADVQAATLLIVGERDADVLRLNQQAYEKLRCIKHLQVIANATHLFEEAGTLEEVARLAAAWFEQYLVPAQSGQPEHFASVH